MPIFEIEINGQVYEVDAPSQQAALDALQAMMPRQDTVASDAPEGLVFNPYTGQMTTRELLTNYLLKNREQSNAGSFQRGAAQGVTFGGVDEMTGALTAVRGGPGSMSERYDFGREYARAGDDAAQQANPYFYMGGEIAGAAAPALALYGGGVSGLGNQMAQGAKIGASEGLAYGALSGEGGAAERGKNAVKYGMFGAGTGAAAPLATAAGAKVYQGASDLIGGGLDAVTGRGSRGRASRALAKTLERSGRSLDDMDSAMTLAAREGQPEYILADALGSSGQRRLSAVARSGGDGAAEIREFLESRQAGQPDRVSGILSDAFDLSGGTAKQTRAALKSGRSEAADISFNGIRGVGNPVDIRPIVAAIDEKIAPFKQAGIDDDALPVLEGLRKQLIGKGEGGTYELSDFSKVFTIRKRLRPKIENAFKSSDSDLGNQLKDIRAAFDKAMSESSDEYAAAMADYAKQSRVIDAVEAGQEMAAPSSRAADNAGLFASMDGSQQAAARVGYGDVLSRRLETQAGGANRARPLTSMKARGDLDAIAIDPARANRQIQREMDMFETRNRVSGGSLTADNMADVADLRTFDAGILANIFTGNFGTAAAQMSSGLANALTGMNGGTRKMIADALLASDTQVLRAAVQQIQDASARREVLNAILRSGILRTQDPKQLVGDLLVRVGVR